jgi:hypothetical protein
MDLMHRYERGRRTALYCLSSWRGR